jgi:hypothetical protein
MAKATLSDATTNRGTPDPRNADAYPPVSGTPMTQWAWEFLRRDEGYRRRWEQLIADRGSREICETEEGRQTHWRSPTEALRAEFRVCTGMTPGINNTLDPADSRAPLFEGAEIVYEIEQLQREPIRPPKVVIEFDATLVIEPQLDGARRLLDERARELSSSPRKVRPPLGKFQTYLRLIDFQNEGATDREIGEHLFPHLKGGTAAESDPRQFRSCTTVAARLSAHCAALSC